jgi:selenocysteine-specific elongation factor
MRHLTVGVLGHVDHGKTTLVKALTGVDTDRLKEEKERGISIVLGFADLALPSGRVAFVDVPGHERFVRTMVSGATGIRAVLLAVAANEGVMPQTVEHLEIAALLGIRRGIVALTQCDRVDPEVREEAIADVKRFLSKTFLAGAPLVATSSVTGEGLDRLRVELDGLVRTEPPVEDEGHAYLPVDRVFTMAGAGTIVTGTLRRGSLAEGDDVEIYPRGGRAAVRQVQMHGTAVSRGLPGGRVAVNLRHVPKEAIARGDALAHPGTLQAGRFLDVELALLESAASPLRHGQRLRVLFGTSEVFGRAHLIDRQELAPGDQCLCQLHLEGVAAFLVKEHFIVRAYSPVRTLGGGRLLGATASRRRREAGVGALEILSRGRLDEVLALRCSEAEPAPIDLRTVAMAERFALGLVLESAEAPEFARVGEWGAVRTEAIESMRRGVSAALEDARRADPMAPGLSAEELLTHLGEAGHPVVLAQVLREQVRTGTLTEHRGKFSRAADAGGDLGEADRELCAAIEAAFKEGGLEPPPVTEAVGLDKNRGRAYRRLVDTGVLIVTHVANKPRTAANTIVFHRETIERAQAELVARFGADGGFDTAQAKAALGTSRKFLIPLLELLDARQFTRRRGEARVFVHL